MASNCQARKYYRTIPVIDISPIITLSVELSELFANYADNAGDPVGHWVLLLSTALL